MKHISPLSIRIDDDLQLRLHEMRYSEVLLTLQNYNNEHLRKWMPWASEVATLESVRVYIRQSLQEFAEGVSQQTGIWYQDRLVGAIGLHSLNSTDHKAKIGYWLDAAMQGKGIMTRTCRALITYAFAQYDMNKIEIHCATENARSRAIPTRLGFTQEGIQRQSQLLNGHVVDMVIYGMLASEWQESA